MIEEVVQLSEIERRLSVIEGDMTSMQLDQFDNASEFQAGSFVSEYTVVGAASTSVFDTGPMTSTQWTIKIEMAENGGIYMLGTQYAFNLLVDGVTRTTVDGVLVWSSGTITDDTKQACFLEMNRKGSTVTIVAADEFPNGSASKYEYTEIVPLWWFGWNDSDDVIDNIIDMRHAARLPGMA